MKFSNKTYNYLDSLSRDKNYTVTDLNEVTDYFDKQNIPPFDKVVEFQMEYSGLKMTIYDKETSTFNAKLFSKTDIITNAKIDCLQINGQYYFDCGDHETAPFWFVLSHEGELCVYNNNDQTVNPIFSSFEKFIETYAFEDLLSKDEKYEDPQFYNLVDLGKFENLTKEYLQHIPANDNYNKWISKDGLIIHQGTWLDKPSFFVHLYGDNKLSCETFIQTIKESKIIT